MFCAVVLDKSAGCQCSGQTGRVALTPDTSQEVLPASEIIIVSKPRQAAHLSHSDQSLSDARMENTTVTGEHKTQLRYERLL